MIRGLGSGLMRLAVMVMGRKGSWAPVLAIGHWHVCMYIHVQSLAWQCTLLPTACMYLACS